MAYVFVHCRFIYFFVIKSVLCETIKLLHPIPNFFLLFFIFYFQAHSLQYSCNFLSSELELSSNFRIRILLNIDIFAINFDTLALI